MEQHPLPRNISSFQFRLVGDMTMRQFGYLAGGAGIAFLIFKLAPLPGIIKWPLLLSAAFGGIAFAFLPIQERPLDKWLVAFIKSINSPTQYLWRKELLVPEILLRSYSSPIKKMPENHQAAHVEAKKKLDSYLSNLPKQPHQELNIREKHYVDRTMQLFTQSGSYSSGQIIQPGITPPQAPTSTPVSLPIGKIERVKAEVSPGIFSEGGAEKIPEETAKRVEQESAELQEKKENEELGKILAEKDKLAKELEQLKKEISKSQKPFDSAQGKPEIVKPVLAPEKKEPTIKTVSPKTAVSEIGIPKLPQVPNIIMGIIKDTQGKILPNIILTIKDLNGTPHRALKTNRLGQFSTATPLQNGTYRIEAEDPLNRYVFDIAEINLADKVFLPIEITAKGEKELMREKLTKEIFGSQGAAV